MVSLESNMSDHSQGTQILKCQHSDSFKKAVLVTRKKVTSQHTVDTHFWKHQEEGFNKRRSQCLRDYLIFLALELVEAQGLITHSKMIYLKVTGCVHRGGQAMTIDRAKGSLRGFGSGPATLQPFHHHSSSHQPIGLVECWMRAWLLSGNASPCINRRDLGILSFCHL